MTPVGEQDSTAPEQDCHLCRGDAWIPCRELKECANGHREMCEEEVVCDQCGGTGKQPQ